MRNLRRFLTPGWILGVIAVILFAWACFALLAPWQLGKSDDLQARNDRIATAIEAAPAPVDQLVNSPLDFTDHEWRLVTVSGQWRPESEALLRLRSVDGTPVYQVLTPFAADSGTEYLVNRGHVPVGEAGSVPDYAAAPSGEVEITARLRKAETGESEPVTVDGQPTVRVIDPAVLGRTLDQPLEDAGYLQLISDQPGSLAPVPIPGIEAGPYLSYGLQWLLFGILAPAGLGYFAWAEIKARRRDAENAAADGTADGAADGAAQGAADGVAHGVAHGAVGSDSVDPDPADDRPASTPEDDATAARERAMRARYGSRDDAERRRAHRRADRLRS